MQKLKLSGGKDIAIRHYCIGYRKWIRRLYIISHELMHVSEITIGKKRLSWIICAVQPMLFNIGTHLAGNQVLR